MADINAQIAEAEQNISTARQNVAEQRLKIAEYREQAKSIQTPARDINFQQNVIRKNPRFFAGRTEQIIGQRKRIRRESLAQADIADKELDMFESNVLAPAQDEVNRVKAQLAEQAAEEAQFDTAKRYASRGVYPYGESRKIRELYSKIRSGYDSAEARNKTLSELKAQGIKPVYSGGQITGFEDSKLGMSYSLDNIPSSFTSMRSPAELKKLEKVGFTLEQKQIETPEFQMFASSPDVLQPVQSPSNVKMGFLDRLKNKLGMASAKPLSSNISMNNNAQFDVVSGSDGGDNSKPRFRDRIGNWITGVIGSREEAKEGFENITTYGDLAIIGGQPYNLTTGRQINVVSAAPLPEDKLERASYDIGTKKRIIYTEISRGQKDPLLGESKSFVLGLGETAVSSAIFAKNLIFDPKETLKGTVTGAYSFAKNPRPAFESLGTSLRENPGFITGRVAGEILLAKGSQVATVKGLPKVTSTLSRLDPRYRPVVSQASALGMEEQVIKDVSSIGDIGLIPPGKPKLPKGIPKSDLPPSIRGGFGYSKSEQLSFIGEKGVITSQRNLIPIISKEKLISEIEPNIGLFATPAFKGRLNTRVSRLGETPKIAKLSDIMEGDISFKPTRPQILVFPKEIVGKGNFKPVKLFTTELEVGTKPNVIARKIKTVGVTAVGGFIGRRVPIIEAEIVTGSKEAIAAVRKISLGLTPSKSESRALYRETGFSSSSLAVSSKHVVSKTGLGLSIIPKRKRNKETVVRTEIPRLNSVSKRVSSSITQTISVPRRGYSIVRPSPNPRIANNLPRLPQKTSRSKLPVVRSPVPPIIGPPITKVKPPKRQIFKRKIPLERGRKLIRKYRQPIKYLPSFSAAAFNIRARRKPAKIMGGYLPGIRPIIVRRRKSKRR